MIFAVTETWYIEKWDIKGAASFEYMLQLGSKEDAALFLLFFAEYFDVV